MARLWIIAGPNGAGKSTLVEDFNRAGLPVSNPDELAKQINPDNPEKAQIEAGRRALTERRAFLASDQSFLIETTFSGRGALQQLEEAKQAGFKTSLVVVGIKSAATSFARVATRVMRGGHSVPAADIERRYQRTFDNVNQALTLVDLAFVVDNSKRRPSLVAKIERGKVTRLSPKAPAWILKQIPLLARHRAKERSQGMSL